MTTEEAKKICKLIGCSGISPELCEGHPEDCKIMLLIEIQRKGRKPPMSVMDSIEEKYQDEIAALKAEVGLKDKQNAELRERLNKSWEREDAQGHDLLRLTVTIADLKEEKAKEFFACAKLMGEKKEEIATLKAEMERLREVLKRIRDWPYDIMGDCVYDARKEAQAALKEAANEPM